MAQRGRPGLTAEQKRELRSRWKAGESLSEIGRALGRQPGSIHGVVASNGGYVPARRRRSARALSLTEREEISRGLAEGVSLRAIAARSGRAPSTISREIARHGGRTRYRAARADERAWERARRPKLCKLAASPRLRELVAAKLGLDWSPQQISGWPTTLRGSPTSPHSETRRGPPPPASSPRRPPSLPAAACGSSGS